MSTGRARLGWGVFLLTLAAYLLTANGHIQAIDSEYYYRMARSLAVERSFAIPPIVVEGNYELSGMRGTDGRFYAQYAPGFPLALAPLVLGGRNLDDLFSLLYPPDKRNRLDFPEQAGRFFATYFNGPVSAGTAGLLALGVSRLGYGRGAAALTGLTYGLGTFAWGQARSLFPEPLQGLLLLASWLLVGRGTARAAWLGGAALGLAELVKPTAALVLPGLLILVAAGPGRAGWREARQAVGVVVPAGVGLLLLGVYNAVRFGSPLTTGYQSGSGGGLDFGGNVLVGLFGLLLSSGRGLLWYAPVVLMAGWGYRMFRQEHPRQALGLAMVAVPWLVVHALWRDWDGGWGWGPRYLLPILPLLLLPLAGCWGHGRWPRLGAAVLVGLGMLLQIPGATVDFMDWGRELSASYRAFCDPCTTPAFRDWRYLWNPAVSDIRGHVQFMLAGRLDLAWLNYADTWLLPATLGLAAALAGAGGWLLASARPGVAAGAFVRAEAARESVGRPVRPTPAGPAARALGRLLRPVLVAFGLIVLVLFGRGFAADQPRPDPASAEQPTAGQAAPSPVDVGKQVDTSYGRAILVTNRLDQPTTFEITVTYNKDERPIGKLVGTVADLPPGRTRAAVLGRPTMFGAWNGEVLTLSAIRDAGTVARGRAATTLEIGQPRPDSGVGFTVDVSNRDVSPHSFTLQALVLRNGELVDLAIGTVDDLAPGATTTALLRVGGQLAAFDRVEVAVDRLLK